MSIKKHNFIQTASYAVIVVANILLIYIFYLMYFPFKTISVEEPVKIYGSTIVKKGDHVRFELHYEKFANVHVERSRSIICDDGNLVTLAPDDTQLPVGKHTLIVNHFVVPEKTSIGICHVVWNANYHINAFREIMITFRSEDFNVTE